MDTVFSTTCTELQTTHLHTDTRAHAYIHTRTVYRNITIMGLIFSDVTPEMLLQGYQVLIATLDFLMVAQIASLLHKVIIQGWELAQFPWIKSIMG